jgi:hypothetical protein
MIVPATMKNKATVAKPSFITKDAFKNSDVPKAPTNISATLESAFETYRLLDGFQNIFSLAKASITYPFFSDKVAQIKIKINNYLKYKQLSFGLYLVQIISFYQTLTGVSMRDSDQFFKVLTRRERNFEVISYYVLKPLMEAVDLYRHQLKEVSQMT